MNCPKCGREAIAEQKFCRGCGATLKIITQPLVEGGSVSHPETTQRTVAGIRYQRASRAMLWGFIIMFIGVALGVIGKMLIEDKVVTVLGVLISLIGMFVTVYPSLAGSPGRKYDDVAPAKREALKQAQSTKRLSQDSNTEYIPSVTERTTDLLQNSTATRLDQKNKGESQV